MTAALRLSADDINHIALVFIDNTAIIIAPVCRCSSYSTDSILVCPIAAVVWRTIVSITSDNYARTHSSLFAKQYNATITMLPYSIFLFLNHWLTFSFSNAILSLSRSLFSSAAGSISAMTIGRTVAPRWINGPSVVVLSHKATASRRVESDHGTYRRHKSYTLLQSY